MCEFPVVSVIEFWQIISFRESVSDNIATGWLSRAIKSRSVSGGAVV